MGFLSEYFIEIILTIISIVVILFQYLQAVDNYEYKKIEYEKKKREYENQFWLFKIFSSPPTLEDDPKEHFGLLLVFIFLSLFSIYLIM